MVLIGRAIRHFRLCFMTHDFCLNISERLSERLYLVQQFVLVRQSAIEKSLKCDDHPLKATDLKKLKCALRGQGLYQHLLNKILRQSELGGHGL